MKPVWIRIINGKFDEGGGSMTTADTYEQARSFLLDSTVVGCSDHFEVMRADEVMKMANLLRDSGMY